MLPVLIHVQAFARSLYQVQFLGFPIAIYVETPTRLYGRQRAHRTFHDLAFAGNGPRDLFLFLFAGWEVLHRPAGLLYTAQGCFPLISLTWAPNSVSGT